MSAIFACCDPENGIVFAGDGVGYDPADGTVTCFPPKITLMPEIGAMFACVGMGAFGFHLLNLASGNYRDFDAMLLDFPELSRAAARCADEVGYPKGIGATVVVGGWSPSRNRHEVYKLHTQPKAMQNTETGEMSEAAPWVLHPLLAPWCSTWPDEATRVAFGFDLSVPDQPAFDLAARAICAARAMSGPSRHEADEGEIYQVGGFLQLALLKGRSVTSWVAHDWPDVAGEAIDPSRGVPMPALPIAVP